MYVCINLIKQNMMLDKYTFGTVLILNETTCIIVGISIELITFHLITLSIQLKLLLYLLILITVFKKIKKFRKIKTILEWISAENVLGILCFKIIFDHQTFRFSLDAQLTPHKGPFYRYLFQWLGDGILLSEGLLFHS